MSDIEKWQSGDVTLYRGDCLEVLPTLGKVDAVITDPPYGLGERWTGGTWGANPMYDDARTWDRAVSQATIDAVTAQAEVTIIWGGNYYAMPPSRCWLSWRKSSHMNTMADFELAWTNLDRPSKEMTEDRNPDGKRKHPTQKPISIMIWCLGFVPDAQTILDPFMGSGTTGVACVKLQRKFIGIEIEPKYFEIAKRRILKAQNETALFDGPVKMKQTTLLEPKKTENLKGDSDEG